MTEIKLSSGEIISVSEDCNKIYEAIEANSSTKEEAYSLFLKLMEFFCRSYGDTVYKSDLITGTVVYMRDLIGLTKEEAAIVVKAAYDLYRGKEHWTYADDS